MYPQTPGWKSNLYQSTATSETLLEVPLIITSIPSTQLLITLFNIIQKERRSSSTWHFSSVTQSCPTRCDPVDGSMPSFPVHHQLPELAQTHVRRVRWCHPTISSSVIPFSSCLQSFPASVSFQMSQFPTSGGQSTGVSASASVLPMNIRDWFPLELTGWIFLQSKGLSRVFFNTTVQKHQFFSAQPSLYPNSHIHTWLLEKP